MPEPAVRFMSARHAAAYLDLTLPTLYEWASSGTMPAGIVARIARRKPAGNGKGRHRVTLRFDKLALDRWLEGRAR